MFKCIIVVVGNLLSFGKTTCSWDITQSNSVTVTLNIYRNVKITHYVAVQGRIQICFFFQLFPSEVAIANHSSPSNCPLHLPLSQ